MCHDDGVVVLQGICLLKRLQQLSGFGVIRIAMR
jgi:hypothetical protein